MAQIQGPKIRTALGLCLGLKGNIGGVTYRKPRASMNVVYYERARKSAFTAKQLAHQARFARGYEQWWTLTDDQRAEWEKAANVASTRMIGSHLFIRVWWRQDTWTVSQFDRWYNIQLALPGP